MTFEELIEDLMRELKENRDLAKKKVQFRTTNRSGLEYLSVCDSDGDTIHIDVGTEEDSDENNKRMLG